MSIIACRAEVDFHEQEVVSVFHETNVSNRDEQFAELCFAGAFAIRQMSNLGISPVSDSIAQLLLAVSQATTEELQELIDARPTIIQYPGHAGRKRFLADFQLTSQGMRMQFDAKGFGFLARGMGYYAPTSVQTLFRYFASRRTQDGDYMGSLGEVAGFCGQLQAARQIQVNNHVQLQAMLIGTCLGPYVPGWLQ